MINKGQGIKEFVSKGLMLAGFGLMMGSVSAQNEYPATGNVEIGKGHSSFEPANVQTYDMNGVRVINTNENQPATLWLQEDAFNLANPDGVYGRLKFGTNTWTQNNSTGIPLHDHWAGIEAVHKMNPDGSNTGGANHAALKFITSNDVEPAATRMTIDQNGDVVMKKNLSVGDGTGNREIRIDGLGNKARFLSYDGGGLHIQTGAAWATGSSADVVFSTMYGQVKNMIIKGDGNVGIGIIDPGAYKLNVAGAFKAQDVSMDGNLLMTGAISSFKGSGKLAVRAKGTAVDGAYIDLYESSHSFAYAPDTKGSLVLGASNNGSIYFETRGANSSGKRMIIDGEGDVNIVKSLDVNGQITAGGRVSNGRFLQFENSNGMQMTVDGNGKITCREIEVTNMNWADFVFADDYSLKSLDEVEAFIDANNHLPDVPSEKEVLANGTNLADMDAILLQKIEELTLYTIQLKKEIEALKVSK